MDTLKEEVSWQMLCNACLCIGRKLYHITDEKLKRYYLGALNEIPLCNMPAMSPIICLDCRALLRKCYDFREQVKDSYRILMTYTSENLNECLLTDVSRAPRLRIVNNGCVHIEPDLTDICTTADGYMEKKRSESSFDKSGENQGRISPKLSPHRTNVDCQKYQNAQVFVKEEMKMEQYESDRDADFDIPLVDLKQIDTLAVGAESHSNLTNNDKTKYTLENRKKKKELKRSKKTGKVKKKKSRKAEDESLDIPSIVTVHMTYEEMLEERERELKRDSYMSAEFKCESCIVGFNYNKSYKKHLVNRHSPSIGKHTCPICKTVLTTVDSFSTHYKRHMRRYECSICQKRTTDLKSMQQHYYSTHEISLKQYKCGDCGKISNSVDSHRYHTDTHKSRLQCSECDKTFRHRGGLLNHKLTVHEAHNKFPCTFCNKVFRWKNSLKRHLPVHDDKNQCGVESVAHCSLCAVSFASVGSYKRHLANSLQHVTKEHLRFICDHCNSRFADKTKLRDHIEEKHLHRTYQCKICLKTFMNRVNLDQHTRNVHRGRPNNKMCHHCGKGFPTKSQLESHIRTHTGERPYICEFCPTTFSQHSNLYKHNRQVHLNMKSKRYPAAKKRKDERQMELSLDTAGATLEYPVDIGFHM